MSTQKGLSPILIILPAAAIAVLILALGIFTFQKGSEKPPVNNNTTQTQDCIKTSYGGCDEDPDFYKWEDDGLP